VTYVLAPQPSVAGPLTGVGVLVTRPAKQAGGFARKLAALGATPIVFPAIVILPPVDRAGLDAAHERLATYDFAFFVSANAVEYGVPVAHRWPPKLVAFAPGPGTAEALVAAGLDDVRIPATTFDSEGLLALPDLATLRGKRAVIFRGEGGRESLAETLAARVRHAGAIFIGALTAEAIGDYVGGPNHVLPTARSARFSSGLSVLDFMKRTTVARITPAALAAIGPAAVRLAQSEGLEAHGLSVQRRLDRLNSDGRDA